MFKSSSYQESKHISFFSTPPEQFPPIISGIFDYNSAFAAFLKATDQKKHTAAMVSAFANKLKNGKVLFDNDEILNVADLGCADSSTCLGYLNQMAYQAGFNYIGFDINDKYIKEAEIILSGNAIIKNHQLIKKDVLSGELSAHPSIHPRSIDLIFVSHLAYYLKNEESGKQFVSDTLNLLNDKGLAIFLHEDSTYYFRSTYNTDYKNSSAPSLLKKSATDFLKTPGQFKEISFTSKLHFTQISDDLWEAAKNPSRYIEFAHMSSFVDTLNKLSFVVQCDLLKLNNEGSLTSFINEMKTLLEGNNYNFNLVTTMQVLVSAQNTHIKEIETALNEIENDSNLNSSSSNMPFQSIPQNNDSSSVCYSC